MERVVSSGGLGRERGAERNGEVQRTIELEKIVLKIEISSGDE